MNKKGFTVIELVTSLTLATVIMIFLFNLVFILKDVYVESEKKATLLIEQAAFSEEVNSFFYNKSIISVTGGSNNSLTIRTSAGARTLKIDEDEKKLEFGNYLYALDDGVNFGDIKICYNSVSDMSGYNKVLFIDVPIKYKDFKENYGLKIAVPLKLSNIPYVSKC